MPRLDDDDDYEGEDWDSDEEETVPCPYCGGQVHEEAQRCPYCEQYISEEDAPPARKPLWIVIGTVLCLVIVYFWIRFRF